MALHALKICSFYEQVRQVRTIITKTKKDVKEEIYTYLGIPLPNARPNRWWIRSSALLDTSFTVEFFFFKIQRYIGIPIVLLYCIQFIFDQTIKNKSTTKFSMT